MSHELITTASLLYARRLHPGIGCGAALALMADPARLDDLCGRFAAFRLSCCFERLKRAGWLEEVVIDDPFDPEGIASVRLAEAHWQAVNAASTPRDPVRLRAELAVRFVLILVAGVIFRQSD